MICGFLLLLEVAEKIVGIDLLYWYSLALGVIAVGLVAGLYRVMGDLLNWTSRIAQYVSGIYFLITVSTTLPHARMRTSSCSRPWILSPIKASGSLPV
jgi:hypothetical protein